MTTEGFTPVDLRPNDPLGDAAGGDGLLGAHHDGVGKAAQQHDHGDDDVHHADFLVVD